MAGTAATERAGGERSDDDHTQSMFVRMSDQPLEVLRRIVVGHVVAGARVEEVEERLHSVKAAVVDDPVESAGVPRSRDAGEADLPLPAKPLDRRDDLL